MTEASKYLRLLQNHSPNSLETHLLSFEVYMRKQKFLLAFQVTDLDPILSCFYNMLCPSILRALLSHFSILQAVKQLLKLDAENPDSHRSLVWNLCNLWCFKEEFNNLKERRDNNVSPSKVMWLDMFSILWLILLNLDDRLNSFSRQDRQVLQRLQLRNFVWVS